MSPFLYVVPILLLILGAVLGYLCGRHEGRRIEKQKQIPEKTRPIFCYAVEYVIKETKELRCDFIMALNLYDAISNCMIDSHKHCLMQIGLVHEHYQSPNYENYISVCEDARKRKK